MVNKITNAANGRRYPGKYFIASIWRFEVRFDQCGKTRIMDDVEGTFNWGMLFEDLFR